jgi:hypothetical protein
MAGRLKLLNAVTVQGDGFTLKKEGLFGLRYTQRDGRSLLLRTELYVDEMGKGGFLVSPEGTRRWAPPHESEELDRDLRRGILAQVCEAVQMMGVHARVVAYQKFTRPKPNIVESSRGYRVHIAGSTKVIYERAGRSMEIEATKDADESGQPRIVLQSRSARWSHEDAPPPRTTELAEALQSVVDALGTLGVRKVLIRK